MNNDDFGKQMITVFEKLKDLPPKDTHEILKKRTFEYPPPFTYPSSRGQADVEPTSNTDFARLAAT